MTLTAILMLAVAACGPVPDSSVAAQKPARAAAQKSGRIPQDPAALTFEASPDHDAVDPSGPRVLKYVIDFLPMDDLGTAKTVDIGKPVPQAGVIRVPLATLGLAPGRYTAQVRVLGQTTSAASAAVGPFQLGKPKAPPAPTETVAPSDEPAPPPEASPTVDRSKQGFWRRLFGLIVGQ